MAPDEKPSLTLSLAELFKLALDLGKYVGTIWTLYVTICTALVGWVLAIKPAALSQQTRWTISFLLVLLTGFFCFVIEFQHEKIRRLYDLIRDHPELKRVDRRFSDAVTGFAAPFVGLTNRIFLPIAGILLVILIWIISP